MSPSLLAIFGNVAAQLYLVMVFATALTTGAHWALCIVIMAEGLTALGYQVQLLEDQPPLGQGLVTLIVCIASWLAGMLAGLMLVF